LVPQIWKTTLYGTGYIDGAEVAGAVEETMFQGSVWSVFPYDLAAVVDPVGVGAGAEDINRGEAAGVVKEAMPDPAAVLVAPYDLAAVVDPKGAGVAGPGDINRGERVLDIGHGCLHAAENDHREQQQSSDSEMTHNPSTLRVQQMIGYSSEGPGESLDLTSAAPALISVGEPSQAQLSIQLRAVRH
jgi:hypothetical protein